jgi:hypothetical protein
MYNDALGTNHKLTSNSLTGNQDSRFIQYVDDEGGDTKQVSVDTVASVIAAAEALKQLENGSISAADTLQKISEIEVKQNNGASVNVSDAINSYIANGDMSGLTQ